MLVCGVLVRERVLIEFVFVHLGIKVHPCMCVCVFVCVHVFVCKGVCLIINTHADINQCAESNGGCAQQCTNLVPGFECSCNAGYQLGQDGTSCNGKLK